MGRNDFRSRGLCLRCKVCLYQCIYFFSLSWFRSPGSNIQILLEYNSSSLNHNNILLRIHFTFCSNMRYISIIRLIQFLIPHVTSSSTKKNIYIYMYTYMYISSFLCWQSLEAYIPSRYYSITYVGFIMVT